MTASPAGEAIGDAYRRAMRRIASTVSVITAIHGDQRHGMTVTALTSVSMDPPSLIVCINQKTRLHELMLMADMFCVNVLHSQQEHLSRAFSGAVPYEERFALGNWANDAGCVALADAQANLFCRRTSFMSYGTHTIFIGEVERVSLREAVAPLIYLDAAYRVASAAN